jgi:thioester reductase-like protein
MIDDYTLASNLGYGQSEYVAERILDIAAEICDIPVTIFRVGLIAGPLEVPKDVWDKSDPIPCLPKTTRALGVVPEMLGAKIRLTRFLLIL